MSRKTDIAWAAGFIDGEGCFYAKKGKTGSVTVQLIIVQVEREPLERMKSILGGHIRGPLKPPSHVGRPFYEYKLLFSTLASQIDELKVYLCTKQRTRYDEGIARRKGEVI